MIKNKSFSEENVMYINRSFFVSLAASLLLTNAVFAQVSQADTSKRKAVLFKIHDITPVKNNEGEITGCEYTTTFYNRSSVNIAGAVLDLVWHDEAVSEVIDQEKKQDAAENNVSMNRAHSTTERTADKKLSTSIEVPAIAPSRQVVVNSTINSDRCFLLIEDVDFTVKNCKTASLSGNESGSVGSCDGMFMFVSPKDAQYYLEFKAVPVSEQKLSAKSKFDKQKEQNDDKYRKTINAMDGTSSILSGIK